MWREVARGGTELETVRKGNIPYISLQLEIMTVPSHNQVQSVVDQLARGANEIAIGAKNWSFLIPERFL